MISQKTRKQAVPLYLSKVQRKFSSLKKQAVKNYIRTLLYQRLSFESPEFVSLRQKNYLNKLLFLKLHLLQALLFPELLGFAEQNSSDLSPGVILWCEICCHKFSCTSSAGILPL